MPRLFMSMLLVCAPCVLNPAQSFGQPPTPRVFTLILVTQRSDLKDRARISADNLLSLHETARTKNPGVFLHEPVTVGLAQDRKAFTATTIKNAIETTFSGTRQFGPDDTILCYVLSHGGNFPSLRRTNGETIDLYTEEFEYGHFIELDQVSVLGGVSTNKFMRVDLFEQLLDARQRAAGSAATASDRRRGLTVLITDSCNNSLDAPSLNFDAAASSDDSATLFSNLLTKFQGQVSLNSAARDELAWYSPQVGGRFTNALLRSLTVQTINNWVDLVKQTDKTVQADFRAQAPNGKVGPDGQTYTRQTPMWMRGVGQVSVRQ